MHTATLNLILLPRVARIFLQTVRTRKPSQIFLCLCLVFVSLPHGNPVELCKSRPGVVELFPAVT